MGRFPGMYLAALAGGLGEFAIVGGGAAVGLRGDTVVVLTTIWVGLAAVAMLFFALDRAGRRSPRRRAGRARWAEPPAPGAGLGARSGPDAELPPDGHPPADGTEAGADVAVDADVPVAADFDTDASRADVPGRRDRS